MKIVDANVLLYAVNRQAPGHDAAHRWLVKSLSGPETVGCRGSACRPTSGWLAAPTVVTVEPGPRHALLLRTLLVDAGTAGNVTSDAPVAALALENGAEVATFDRDLLRFGVIVVVPG